MRAAFVNTLVEVATPLETDWLCPSLQLDDSEWATPAELPSVWLCPHDVPSL